MSMKPSASSALRAAIDVRYRSIRFFCICARRRSSTRCVRRTVSDRFSSSVWNGGGVDAVGIEHDLHDAFAVAQVDEDHAAVIATPMHPAGDGDRLPEVAFVDATAIVSAFQDNLQLDASTTTRAATGRAGRERQLRIPDSACSAGGAG